MANLEHLAILKQGIGTWNSWRNNNYGIKIDLIEADLLGVNLRAADLIEADLSRAKLIGVDLSGADLSRARLGGADLSGADLHRAKLKGTNLGGADLVETNLREANLEGANLSGAYLGGASLVGTNLDNANLTHCHIYGVSVWDIEGHPRKQRDLVITPLIEGVAEITVDDLEMAQFIYLILNNTKIRSVIDTITSKAVLILGRFTDDRRAVLDALRDELRNRGFVPILFDWDKPSSRDITETVQLLASMARFMIADITEAKSIPQELSHIIPFLPSVPVKPILLSSELEYAMFEHWRSFNSVLPKFLYEDQGHLLANFQDEVIGSVEAWKAGQDTEKLLREKIAAMTERIKQLEESSAG